MISIGDVPVVPVVFPDGTQKIDLQLEAMYREITENKTGYIVFLKILESIFHNYNKI